MNVNHCEIGVNYLCDIVHPALTHLVGYGCCLREFFTNFYL